MLKFERPNSILIYDAVTLITQGRHIMPFNSLIRSIYKFLYNEKKISFTKKQTNNVVSMTMFDVA